MKTCLTAGPFTSGYVTNIDLSKPQQVKGVTNLALVPIIESKTVGSFGGEETYQGPSALDGFGPQQHRTYNRGQTTHYVDRRLQLNLA